MSLPRYPNYKDSGVEWLGEVPRHWEVTALKRGFNVTLGKMLQPESSSPGDELLPYLRAANIQWNGVDTTEIKQMWMSVRDRAQLNLKSGDLLVSEGGDVGRSCLWAGELDNCYFQNSVNRVRATDGNSNRFLYYWISTVKNKGYIDVLCNKSTIAHFTAEKVAAVPVPFPPPVEQVQIVAFLDRETAKIDELVAEQRRLMALLKEKRQAVISHAVTRGLNPDAPLKPSGIEWLGDVPAHWEVKQLKRLARLVTGMTPPTDDPDNYVDSEGFQWVRPENLDESGAPTTATKYLSEKGWEQSRQIAAGASLICCIGTIGKVGFTEKVVSTNQQITAALPHEASRYLYFALSAARLVLELASTGNVLRILNTERLGSIPFPVPPKQEADSISEHLDKNLAKLDTLTTEAQRAIDLLQERRTALISAAVTGQIDVRGAGS